MWWKVNFLHLRVFVTQGFTMHGFSTHFFAGWELKQEVAQRRRGHQQNVIGSIVQKAHEGPPDCMVLEGCT